MPKTIRPASRTVQANVRPTIGPTTAPINPQKTEGAHLSNTAVVLRSVRLMMSHPLLFVCVSALLAVQVVLTMLSPVLVQRIIDAAGKHSAAGHREAEARIAAFLADNPMLMQLLGVSVLTALFMFVSSIVLTYFQQKIIAELRVTTISHAMRQSMDYFSKEPIGAMVTRMTSDLDSAGAFLQTLLQSIASALLSTVGVSVTLFIINKNLTLALFGALPLVLITVEIYRRKILRASQRFRAERGILTVYTTEYLQGAMDVQIYNKTEESSGAFNNAAESYYRARRVLGYYQAFIRPFMNLFLAVFIFIILVAGAYFVGNAMATVGTVIAFVQLASTFFNPILTLAQSITQIQESMAGTERIFLFLDFADMLPQRSAKRAATLEAKLQAQRAKSGAHDPAAPAAIIKSSRCTLAAHDAGFYYRRGSPILKNISFTLEPEKRIAVVGHSGSGKSTLARLCVRFWDVTSGRITLDGHNIAQLPLHTLRSSVRLLQQDSFIFDGTLRENLTMGKDIPQRELDALANTSGLSDVLSSLPHGWDSEISAQRLSSGEQRLITICRVFLNAPPVLILDEFSATLDNRTEQSVQQLIGELQKSRASLIIAHRLNTIKTCDEILVLDGGHIAERGSHESLMERGGLYGALVQDMKETIKSIT